MQEYWTDIHIWGTYKVSTFGRVKSLEKGILKPFNNGNGYLCIHFYNKGVRKSFSVHRLVGLAFHGLDINDKNTLVCHKDDNPANNHKDNLFLGTHKDNTQDMISKGRQGYYGHILGRRSLNQYDKKGTFIKTWEYMYEIQEKLGINQGNISRVCNGKSKTAGGFIWKFST